MHLEGGLEWRLSYIAHVVRDRGRSNDRDQLQDLFRFITRANKFFDHLLLNVSARLD